jgi:3-oxoacyl-(acyl-carrier-protein) synthase
MTRTAVISGIGVVLPETQTLEKLWSDQLVADTDNKQAPIANVIDEDMYEGRLSSRLSKKLDEFTRYAMVATQYAIEDAGLDMETVDKERCGVFVGNCFGGWRFTEVELRNLHCNGARTVSPFQATSWFPAAPQGQISIYHGIKGFSKTYMADRASSLLSVASAAEQIKQGKLDVAIAGGTESTNTDFVKAALKVISAGNNSLTHFTPFDPEGHNGFAISEGAVFLILEDSERAARRGASIYAQVDEFAMRTAPCEADRYSGDSAALIKSMKRVCGNKKPDLTMPDACGLSHSDRAEAAALNEACDDVPLVFPKARYGHSFGAEGALDIAYACLMLRKQQALPTQTKTLISPLKSEQVFKEAKATRLDRILINACATGGTASSLLLSRGVI